MSNLLVITGITGKQGSAVADFFLTQEGWRLRGTTRNPDSASARAWQDKGIEIVAANFDDLESLKTAFYGATHIFGVTDYLAVFKDPEHQTQLKESESMSKYAYDFEVVHIVNLAKAAAAIPTLQRYVFSALPDPNEFPDSEKFANLYHFHSKRSSSQYISKHLPQLYAKYSEIQLSIYNDGYVANWFLGPKLENGKLYMDYFEDGKGRFVNTALSDTGPGLHALLTKGRPGQTLVVDSDVLSLEEALAIISNVKGYPNGGIRHVSWEAYMTKMLPPIGEELAKTHMFLEIYWKGFEEGKVNALRLKDLGVTGTKLQNWVEQHDFDKFNNPSEEQGRSVLHKN